MRKMTLICEDGQHYKNVLECSPWSLQDALSYIEKFLKANGYEINGILQVNNPSKPEYGQWKDYNPTTMTHSNGLTVSQISTLNSLAKEPDWSSVNKYPTMSPLTTEQIKPLTTADLSAFTLKSSDLSALKSVDLTGFDLGGPSSNYYNKAN